MLIINADDFGINKKYSTRIIDCFKKGVVSTTGAMVFMAESKEASIIAETVGLEVGLHLNFTQRYDEKVISYKLLESQERIAHYLLTNKYRLVFYNPLLKNDFDYVYKAQYDEFMRLYNVVPAFINGHHHMHLCANILFSNLIPKGSIVRRNFSFNHGEKNIFNRYYRLLIDKYLLWSYKSTDRFYSNLPVEDIDRLQSIIMESLSEEIELMVHPGVDSEYYFLMEDLFFSIIKNTSLNNFRNNYK